MTWSAMSRPVRWGLTALAVVTVIHLGLIELLPGSPAAIITKTLLMPILAAVVMVARPRPRSLLLLVLEPAADLLVPLAVYAVVLTAMALLASGLGPLATAGGLVFLLSDSLLALRVFAYPSVPTLGVWIMLTYVLGQALIVLGALDQARARPSSPPLVGVNP